MKEAVAREIFQYATGVALLLLMMAGLFAFRAKQDQRRYGLDRPQARTEQGRAMVEAKRRLLATGYQAFIVRWLVRLGLLSALVALIFLPILLALRS